MIIYKTHLHLVVWALFRNWCPLCKGRLGKDGFFKNLPHNMFPSP